MTKFFLKIILGLMVTFGIVKADPIDLNGNVKGVDVSIKSTNSLVVGENDFLITLNHDGNVISDAKVKAKFFMPEMPGMPYMEYIEKAKYNNGAYKMNINFSMNGTWQYQLKFMTKDGKKYKIRGSVNL